MATADFEFKMTVNGKTEELISILKVLRRYNEGENGVYFSGIDLNGEHLSLIKLKKGKEMDDDEIIDFVLSNDSPLTISALGPYGHYSELNDVDIFRDMAEAAPEAAFEGHISGFTSYTEQYLDCKLSDKILHITTYFEANEESADAYIEYVLKLLPYEKFIELFHVDEEQFSEDSYQEFINDICVDQDDCLTDIDYDEFVDNLQMYVEDFEIEESEYEEIMEKLQELNIEGYYDFHYDYEAGEKTELDYDPIAKKYIGNEKNILKSNTVYDVTDEIKEYLCKNNLPYDDDTIANLSVEDVYSIMAGTYGKESSEDSI